jgi:hypothetical protein
MDPTLILFVIEAAVKLGWKVYDVLVDATAEKPLVLPLGNLFQDVQINEATQFFLRKENRHLILPGGPYENFTPDEQLKAYRTLQAINGRLENPYGNLDEAADIVDKLHAFEQFKKGFGARSPAQRILGTIVEIGIDYFSTHPEALGRDSKARRVVQSFVQGLDNADFAEGSLPEIVGDVLGAALRTFENNVALVDDDKRVQALLGGITKSLAEEISAVSSATERLDRTQLLRRIASSVVRGGVGAFSENIDLFVPQDGTLKKLVGSTLTQVLAGIKDQEDLFNSASLELVFRSALGAVGENAALFTDDTLLQELISRTVKAMTDTTGQKLFSEETVAVVLREALEVVRENVETLIDPKDPQHQLLANAVAAMARSLATSLGGGGKVKDLLSTRQLTELSRVVFEEVAKHPEQLLGENLDDTKKTALAQIIGSVARALGDDPARLVNGSGFIELVRVSLQVAVRNADKLIDLDSADTRTNVLFQVIQQLATAVIEQGDPRKIVTRDVFVEIVRRVLPVVSANLDPLLAGTSQPVADTVRTVLAVASGALQNQINGANLPVLMEQMLRAVLARELNVAETVAVERTAREILKAAA